MNVKSHISKTIASSWLSLVVTSLCQLVMIPIALGVLDKSDFALFAVISQMMLAIKLAELGIRSACARLLIDAHAEGKDKFQRVWMASLCVFAGQAFVMLLITLSLAPFLETLFELNAEQREIALWFFIVIGVINALNYALSIFPTALLAGQQLSRVNVAATIGAVVQLVVFVVAIKFGAKLWAYPLGMLATNVVTLYLVIGYARKLELVGKFDLKTLEWTEVKTIFNLGLDVFVAGLFSVVMGNSLLIFSGYLLSLEETAILAVNLKLVSMMTQILQRIPGSAEPVLMKLVSEGEANKFIVWWKFVTKSTVSISLICAGMFVIWSEFVVTRWTSEEMVMRGMTLSLLALMPFRYLTNYMFVFSLSIFKEMRKVKMVLVWEVILYSALACFLGAKYGLLGLLSANILSMFGGSLFMGLKWMSVYTELSLKSLIRLLINLSVPLGIGFAFICVTRAGVVGSGFFANLAASILWGCVSGVLVYLMILDQEERGKLKLLVCRYQKI